MTKLNFTINGDPEGEVLKEIYSKILSWTKPEEKTAPSEIPLAGNADRAAKSEVQDEIEPAPSNYIPRGQ